MGNTKVTPAATKKLTPSFIKRLTEVLMIKSGIKAGPEGTFGQ